MATQPPGEVAPDAVFTQTPPASPTPQPDGKDRSTWNGWPSRNTAQPRVLIDDQARITRIRTPVLDLTDEVGRVEPHTPRFNNMRKNFSAIVKTDVTVV